MNLRGWNLRKYEELNNAEFTGSSWSNKSWLSSRRQSPPILPVYERLARAYNLPLFFIFLLCSEGHWSWEPDQRTTRTVQTGNTVEIRRELWWPARHGGGNVVQLLLLLLLFYGGRGGGGGGGGRPKRMRGRGRRLWRLVFPFFFSWKLSFQQRRTSWLICARMLITLIAWTSWR